MRGMPPTLVRVTSALFTAFLVAFNASNAADPPGPTPSTFHAAIILRLKPVSDQSNQHARPICNLLVTGKEGGSKDTRIDVCHLRERLCQ